MVPLNGTSCWSWRRRLHDAVDSRRGRNPLWKNFGLIARWDGPSNVTGVACLANLGLNDLRGLFDCNETRAMQNDADSVAQVLLAAPISPLPGSIKNIFLTINPRSDPKPIARPRPTQHYEPLPFIL